MLFLKNFLNNRRQSKNAKILTNSLELKFPIGLAIVFLLLAFGYVMLFPESKSASVKCMNSCRTQGLGYIYSPTGTTDGVHPGGSLCTCLKK